MVVQFGLAMMPLRAFAIACAVDLGDDSGTSGSMRQADELSITVDARRGELRRQLARRRAAGGEQRDVEARRVGQWRRPRPGRRRPPTAASAGGARRGEEADRRRPGSSRSARMLAHHRADLTGGARRRRRHARSAPLIGRCLRRRRPSASSLGAELERVVHGAHGGVEVGVAADDRDADLRGGDHLDVDAGLGERREERRRHARVRAHAGADQRQLADVVVVEQVARNRSCSWTWLSALTARSGRRSSAA